MWKYFEDGDFSIWLKHYDEPSTEFGLNGSRVSKLFIKRYEKVVFNYDRGLDIPAADSETEDIVKKVLEIYG